MKDCKVVIVDDDDGLRAVVRMGLEVQPGITVVLDVDRAHDVVEQIGHLQPDVLVLDHQMPGMTGLEAIPHVRGAAPRTKIVMLTADPSVRRSALAAGAHVVLEKTAPGVLEALVEQCRAAEGSSGNGAIDA